MTVARIALVKPDMARGLEAVILRAAQMGQITEKVLRLLSNFTLFRSYLVRCFQSLNETIFGRSLSRCFYEFVINLGNNLVAKGL
jgi:hypothetical protein